MASFVAECLKALRPVLLAVLAAEAVAGDKTVVIPSGDVVLGRCVGVHDGDSITILLETPDGKRQAKIRLDAIDAPELGQPFSARSKETLASMVFDKECRVESRGEDRYGRTVGRVSVNGEDVNAAMLSSGMAWHAMKYDSRKNMAAKQTAAQHAKIGLWKEPNPIPPWDWRKMSREQRKVATEANK